MRRKQAGLIVIGVENIGHELRSTRYVVRRKFVMGKESERASEPIDIASINFERGFVRGREFWEILSNLIVGHGKL